MSEPHDSAKPDADDAPLGPLPEPVLGSDEDGAPDFGEPDAGPTRPPFLSGLDADADAPETALAEPGPGTALAAPTAPANGEAAAAPAPVGGARSRRVWRELRYAAITQEKPPVVVPPPVIDDQGRLIRKYLFEHSFDVVETPPEPEPDDELVIEELPPEPVEVVAIEPPPPTFSEAELAAARAAGHAEGDAAGRAAAASAIESRIAELTQAIANAIPGLAADRDQAVAAVSQEAARLAHAMVRRIMPELARRYRIEEIEAVVIDSLNKALDQPRIIIRTPSDVTGYLTDRLETVARQHGFGGRVIVLSDPGLGPSDVKVEWGDGGAERCVQRAWGDIDAIVARVVERLEQVAPVTAIPPGEPGDTIGSAA
jgi:flagellar assembly protein FliH